MHLRDNAVYGFRAFEDLDFGRIDLIDMRRYVSKIMINYKCITSNRYPELALFIVIKPYQFLCITLTLPFLFDPKSQVGREIEEECVACR